MICVADSGSTKTAWFFIDEAGRSIQATTSGINPSLAAGDSLLLQLQDDFAALTLPFDRVSQVFFYGAGCTNDEKKAGIKSLLAHFFTQATLSVEDDLVGAAKACCGDTAGVVAILGTGANSGFYDGQAIVEQIPPLGYILGDEGSGAYLGKQLIRAYFYNEMPDDLRPKFQQMMPLSRTDMIERVYRQSKANVFLANLTRFLSQYREHDFCQQLLENSFNAFCLHHLRQYPTNEDVHFVGSIASVFSDELSFAVQNNGLFLGRIVANPIEELVNYHFSY